MPASVLTAKSFWRSDSFVRWFIFFSIALVGIISDLVSKSLTYQIEPIDIIPGIFRFSFVLNKGIIWGIASQGSILFLIIPSFAIPLILLIFKYIHVFSGHPEDKSRFNLLITVAFGLIMAGAVGNLYDRIFFHGVRDFLDFYFINWPIFNLADVYISIGVALIIIDVFRKPIRTAIQLVELKPDTSNAAGDNQAVSPENEPAADAGQSDRMDAPPDNSDINKQ